MLEPIKTHRKDEAPIANCLPLEGTCCGDKPGKLAHKQCEIPGDVRYTPLKIIVFYFSLLLSIQET